MTQDSPTSQRLLVALSGGVDSAVAALRAFAGAFAFSMDGRAGFVVLLLSGTVRLASALLRVAESA